MNLGEAIRRIRKKKKMTQLALAHLMGYTGPDAGSYISRVEAGTQVPRLATLGKIADALDTEVTALIS